MKLGPWIILCLSLVWSAYLTAQSAPRATLQSEDDTYAVFLLVRSTSAWLALAPKQRFEFLDAEIQPLLEAHPKVSMKFWDTEHFSSRVTDVILLETPELGQYRSLVEGLRETRFWGHYFEVIDILPGIENAYADHYGVTPFGVRDARE